MLRPGAPWLSPRRSRVAIADMPPSRLRRGQSKRIATSGPTASRPNEKGGACAPPLRFHWWTNLEVHATHAAAARHRRGGGLILRRFADHRFRGDQERGDRGGVLQGGAHHL